MTCIPIILALMLSWPQYHLDRGDSPAARRALYRPVAEAICAVAQTRMERVWLAVQFDAETHGARYVLEGRCADGPKGERCDWCFSRCYSGKPGPTSTGPWQAKRRWCPLAVLAPTLRGRYKAGARCALRTARRGFKKCGAIEGAFAHQLGAGRCHARWAAARARRVEQILARVP